jgi:hypothetical protein
MSFYIKFENNNPVGHPSTLENLQQIYPNFLNDFESLGYFPIKILRPPVTVSSFPTIIHEPRYELQNGVATMYYITRQMTQQEKQRRYNEMLDYGHVYTGWTLDPETLHWDPPFTMPDDGQYYYWDNDTQNWKVQISSEPE